MVQRRHCCSQLSRHGGPGHDLPGVMFLPQSASDSSAALVCFETITACSLKFTVMPPASPQCPFRAANYAGLLLVLATKPHAANRSIQEWNELGGCSPVTLRIGVVVSAVTRRILQEE